MTPKVSSWVVIEVSRTLRVVVAKVRRRTFMEVSRPLEIAVVVVTHRIIHIITLYVVTRVVVAKALITWLKDIRFLLS